MHPQRLTILLLALALPLAAGVLWAQPAGTTGRGGRASSPPPRIGVRLDEGPAGEWRISAVVPLSPAHRAGLMAGDLILKVRGEAVFFDDPEGFREQFRPSPVHLTIERGGDELYFVIHKRVFEM